ncbi:cysteine hydrolase family protein [Salinibacillus xinjiangensis]|uniref:Isochorismatase family protein n=1 Tax=Salinibacillus xinjiangensis TaxID=1229268 RepID=A0A6G1X8E1_9BACI|nr:hypothetical protein [Salinibacillus xinjiangensis]MRG87234.1 hypothetical protein [Salinibacillus xinjiangensis]
MFTYPFEQIVEVENIGEPTKQTFDQFLRNTNLPSVKKAKDDEEKVLLLAIDVQNDFMDAGALGVPGAKQDVERLLQFIHHNFEQITHIMASIDTHKPQQIFHPCWWEDSSGNEPEPLTIITYEDIQSGKWSPRFHHEKSMAYVRKLEEQSKKQLCIWPYHCIQGSYGVSLESQFTKMAYLHSLLRDYELKTVVKGEDPLSEMYGIIQPEYSEKELVRYDVVEEIKQYDKVIIAGEAASHCVIESVIQIVEHVKDDRRLLENIYVLTDCMSSIPGFEEETEKEFQTLHRDYGVQLILTSEW